MITKFIYKIFVNNYKLCFSNGQATLATLNQFQFLGFMILKLQTPDVLL